jgi:hypothetical protein
VKGPASVKLTGRRFEETKGEILSIWRWVGPTTDSRGVFWVVVGVSECVVKGLHCGDKDILAAAGEASSAACLEARPQLFRVLLGSDAGPGGRGEEIPVALAAWLLPRRTGLEGIVPQREGLIGRG